MAGYDLEALATCGAGIVPAEKRGLMLATAESCTGGHGRLDLVDVPGSSRVLERGFVTYSNAAKTELLGVPAETIADHGAVSEETARAMAEGALARAPGRSDRGDHRHCRPGWRHQADKPEGLVHFACARRGASDTAHARVEFGADRAASHVRSHSVQKALEMLLEMARKL